LDEGLGDPQLQRILKDLKNYGNFQSANQTLQQLRQGLWNERSLVCDAVAKQGTSYLYSLDARCADEPGSPIWHLLRGITYIASASNAREDGTSDKEQLLLAEKDLLKVIELDPEDPTPYANLLALCRRMNRSRELAEEYFEAAIKRDPQHWEAHLHMLMLKTAKWGGSHEDMFEFARSAAVRDPSLAVLLMMAHIEYWVYCFFFDNKKGGAEQYLQRTDVQKEALTAYTQFQAAQIKKSRLALVPLKSMAAFWFYLVKDPEHLKPLLEDLGMAITYIPWVYDGGDLELSFDKAKKLAGIG